MSLAAALGEACNDQSISIITADGKVLVGTLKGIDNGTNVILDDSHERVFSTDQGVEKHQLGLCVIRGDNIAVIGQVDRDIDLKLDLSEVRAKPLKQIVH
jgi:U6 snRNA-associated Sm-like protein LSm8